MQTTALPRRYFTVSDLLLIVVLGAWIYGIIGLGREWRSEFNAVTEIDLSIWALPKYSLFSALRGLAAYILSLLFTLIVGYVAAKSKPAEKVIIPLLDILQSIPVLGFLPGLVLGLIAIFPKTNTGLELAAVIMIFTGQVWNMTFSFYSSLKAIPTDICEASTMIGLNRWDRFKQVELPFSAINLTWNSLMSMAGGWFFLSVCEAFSLGEQQYRLPGIGAYMAVAIEKEDSHAMFFAVIAMVLVILAIDFLIWRPTLAWVQKFRLEDIPGASPSEPVIGLLIRNSRLLHLIRLFYTAVNRRLGRRRRRRSSAPTLAQVVSRSIPVPISQFAKQSFQTKVLERVFGFIFIAMIILMLYGVSRLGKLLLSVQLSTWILLLKETGLTLMRVVGALVLSTLWAVPAGIWIGLSSKRIRVAQPIIQVLASFPAPMLYPLVLAILFALRIPIGLSSMFLMLLGVQWYILFNVLAGALQIRQELKDSLELMNASRWDRWAILYLPSAFPALVTGWITAAGGAWNASIVAEYLTFRGTRVIAHGLGATISAATAREDFQLLAASLTVMVVMVILLNRTFWAKIYEISQTRFKLDT